MQNPYSFIASKILRRIYPNVKTSSSRVILAFYSSASKKDLSLSDGDKCHKHGDQKASIQGKVAIITGGARGIGFDIAQTLLRNGIKGITLADNDCDCGEKSCNSLCEKYGEGCAMFCACDVKNSENMDCVFKRAKEHFKQLDLVINNAGIMNDKRWEFEVTVNIGGCIIGSLLGLQYMSKSCLGKGGVVINIGNTAGIEPLCGCPIYSMTQSAIIGFTRALGSGCQYQRTGVKVMGLCAGPTDTRMMKNVSSVAINEHFANELEKELKERQLQPKSFVSDGILQVLAKGKNGSIWVAHNCKPAFELCFPPSVENMQIFKEDKRVTEKSKSKETIINEKKVQKQIGGKLSKVEKAIVKPKVSKETTFFYNYKTGNCPLRPKPEAFGIIDLYTLSAPPKRILPDDLNRSTDHEWVECKKKISVDGLTSNGMIVPLLDLDNKRDDSEAYLAQKSPGSKKISASKTSLVKPEVKPSTSEHSSVKSVHSKSKLEPQVKVKSQELEPPKEIKQKQPRTEQADINKQDAFKTIELCEELKNTLSNTCDQPKLSAKDACILQNQEEVQKTQLNYPHPQPQHPKQNPCEQTAKKPEKKRSSDKPKVLSDPCKKQVSQQYKEKRQKDKIKKYDVCKDKLRSKTCKKEPQTSLKGNVNKKEKKVELYGMDANGECISRQRKINDTPLKISYAGEPKAPILPKNLGGNASNNQKDHSKSAKTSASKKTSKDGTPKQKKPDGKLKSSKEQKAIDVNIKSSKKIHHSAHLAISLTGERQQSITTQAGLNNAVKTTSDQCSGLVRYDNDQLLKVTRQDYIDEDNIEWKLSTYEEVQEEECGQVKELEKQHEECSDNVTSKPKQIDNCLESSQDPCIKKIAKECNFQINDRGHKEQAGFGEWPIKQEQEIIISSEDNVHSDEICPPKSTPKKSRRKPKGHRIPDPEEYERMCMASRVAWNRCPGFVMKLPKRPVKMSPGMCNAWAACNSPCSPGGGSLAQPEESYIQDVASKTNCAKVVVPCIENDPCSTSSECEDVEEDSEGMRNAWAVCEEPAEDVKCSEENIDVNKDVPCTENDPCSFQSECKYVEEDSEGMRNAWAVCEEPAEDVKCSEENIDVNKDVPCTENDPCSFQSECKYVEEDSEGMRNAWAVCEEPAEDVKCPDDNIDVNKDVPCTEKYPVEDVKLARKECSEVITKTCTHTMSEGMHNAWRKANIPTGCEEIPRLKQVCDNLEIESIENNKCDQSTNEMDGIEKAWARCYYCEEPSTCNSHRAQEVLHQPEDDDSKCKAFRNSRELCKNINTDTCSSNKNDETQKQCGVSSIDKIINSKSNVCPDPTEEILSNAEELGRCIEKIKKLLAKK